jgi:glycosyltransferase involved in cell wall biosynthesis
MLELERRGFQLVIGSMYPPKTPIRHEYLAGLRSPVHYAPEKPALEKLVKKAKRSGRWPEALIAQHERRYGAEYKAALRARNALFFVDLFEREGVPHFHVHFANRAAHTAIFVKAISGIPFSVTAHGQDFMADLGSDDLLEEICATAEWVAAETDFSRDLLRARCTRSAEKILRVYNGIDLKKFPSGETHGRRGAAMRLLSVGRLVAFKGFDVLIDACAALRNRGVDFECEIIGDGPLRAELELRASDGCVRFSGEQSQAYVLRAMADCDVFVLAARVDRREASDVFPTVIAEAMTAGKAVVSTTVAGIPELVVHDQTGILVPPDDPESLATALVRVGGDQSLRSSYGRAGRARIENCFTIQRTIEPLLQRLRSVHTAPATRR